MSGRITRHLSFLTRCLKDISQVEQATAAQVECIVEIVYNIINNEKYLLTDQEIKVLKPVHSQLIDISKIRRAQDARCEILRLSARQFKTVICSAIELVNNEDES